MARLARAEMFDPSEVAVVHICARVRRCFFLALPRLLAKTTITAKLDRRSTKNLVANFGIDLMYFAILSNHLHLIFRPRSRITFIETSHTPC